MTDNPTELLREGLTERGIEWRSGLEGVTFVGDWCFVEYDNGKLAVTCEPVLTPEQVIATTLGAQTAGVAEKIEELRRTSLAFPPNIRRKVNIALSGIEQAIAATLDETYTREEMESVFVSGYSLGTLPVGSDPQWDENRQTVDEHMEDLGWVRSATLGSSTLTAEQVSKAVYSHSIQADCADADWQAIADELNAELGSGTCELVETDSYSNDNEIIHVLECSECGKTCEHVNGSYPRCPHCGAKVVSE